MTNEKLQSILANYPGECEILIMSNDYKDIHQICAEYDEDDDFATPKLVVYI